MGESLGLDVSSKSYFRMTERLTLAEEPLQTTTRQADGRAEKTAAAPSPKIARFGGAPFVATDLRGCSFDAREMGTWARGTRWKGGGVNDRGRRVRTRLGPGPGEAALAAVGLCM